MLSGEQTEPLPPSPLKNWCHQRFQRYCRSTWMMFNKGFAMNTLLTRYHEAMRLSGQDAWLIVGQDHLRHLTGVHLPFAEAGPSLACAVVTPEGVQLLAPALWASSWVRGRVPHITVWHGAPEPATFIRAVAEAIRQLAPRRLGLDRNRASAALVQLLEEHTTLTDISADLTALRAAKTAEEIALLEELAYCADHAILGAAHHSLACDQRAEKGFAEIIRIHGLERGFEAVGFNALSQAATGSHACLYWTEAPKFGIGQGKRTARGEYNRLELQATRNSYWAAGSRLMTQGWPDEAQMTAYKALVTMREAALAVMRPGTPCSAVYAAMRETAMKLGVTAPEDRAWGHSVGVSPQEAPYIAPGDHTPLPDNAVMVLNPHVLGPEGEKLYSRDTVLVNACGCTLLGWYKDWREPYVASDSYYSGGG